MKLFYHHVGATGAAEDFPKTVFNTVPIQVVEEYLDRETRLRDTILTTLQVSFPSGRLNCWGVPSGAQFVIQNLTVDDVVLLVESATPYGSVPALCQVRAFWREELYSLSQALWGSVKFPYIFFFNTEELNLTWGALREELQFSPNFNPRGQFYSVAANKLAALGGVDHYVATLRTRFAVRPPSIYTLQNDAIGKTIGEQKGEYNTDIQEEFEHLAEKTVLEAPVLTDGKEKMPVLATTTPRSAAFRVGVAQLYGYRCAICRLELRSPDGKVEVQSAHIYPKSLDGSDDLRNGIGLCRMHHWAFDAGWFTLTDDCRVMVRSDIPRTD